MKHGLLVLITKAKQSVYKNFPAFIFIYFMYVESMDMKLSKKSTPGNKRTYD